MNQDVTPSLALDLMVGNPGARVVYRVEGLITDTEVEVFGERFDRGAMPPTEGGVADRLREEPRERTRARPQTLDERAREVARWVSLGYVERDAGVALLIREAPGIINTTAEWLGSPSMCGITITPERAEELLDEEPWLEVAL